MAEVENLPRIVAPRRLNPSLSAAKIACRCVHGSKVEEIVRRVLLDTHPHRLISSRAFSLALVELKLDLFQWKEFFSTNGGGKIILNISNV